jgi:Tfp pilus assembly protein FimT
MTGHKRQRGFTLIELMVIGALIAIFVTIAIPGFNSMIENNRTQTAHNELLQLLNYARAQAVTVRAPVSVCTGNSSVTVARGGCGAGNAPLRLLEQSPGISISAEADEVIFRPNGTAVAATFATCHHDDHEKGMFASVEASGSIKSYPRGQAKAGAMTTCDLSS